MVKSSLIKAEVARLINTGEHIQMVLKYLYRIFQNHVSLPPRVDIWNNKNVEFIQMNLATEFNQYLRFPKAKLSKNFNLTVSTHEWETFECPILKYESTYRSIEVERTGSLVFMSVTAMPLEVTFKMTLGWCFFPNFAFWNCKSRIIKMDHKPFAFTFLMSIFKR